MRTFLGYVAAVILSLAIGAVLGLLAPSLLRSDADRAIDNARAAAARYEAQERAGLASRLADAVSENQKLAGQLSNARRTGSDIAITAERLGSDSTDALELAGRLLDAAGIARPSR